MKYASGLIKVRRGCAGRVRRNTARAAGPIGRFSQRRVDDPLKGMVPAGVDPLIGVAFGFDLVECHRAHAARAGRPRQSTGRVTPSPAPLPEPWTWHRARRPTLPASFVYARSSPTGSEDLPGGRSLSGGVARGVVALLSNLTLCPDLGQSDCYRIMIGSKYYRQAHRTRAGCVDRASYAAISVVRCGSTPEARYRSQVIAADK